MIITSKQKRKIIFDGNSLTANGPSALAFAQTYPLSVYASIATATNKIGYSNYAVGGRKDGQLISEFSTKILPYCSPNDILIFWGITNDLGVGGAGDPTAAYNNVVTYCQQAKAAGLFVVVCTMIARNGASDPVGMDTNRLSVNANIRANWASYANLLLDFGSMTRFANLADCDDTNYYGADKIHLVTAGYQLLGTYCYNAIQPYL